VRLASLGSNTLSANNMFQTTGLLTFTRIMSKLTASIHKAAECLDSQGNALCGPCRSSSFQTERSQSPGSLQTISGKEPSSQTFFPKSRVCSTVQISCLNQRKFEKPISDFGGSMQAVPDHAAGILSVWDKTPAYLMQVLIHKPRQYLLVHVIGLVC